MHGERHATIEVDVVFWSVDVDVLPRNRGWKEGRRRKRKRVLSLLLILVVTSHPTLNAPGLHHGERKEKKG